MVLLGGVFLGFAFPPVPTGLLAFVTFVPLFIVCRDIDTYRPVLRYAYIMFLVANVVALYWTGGFVHAKDWYLMVAGLLLIVAHPLFFLVPIAVWLFIRRHFGFGVSLWLFPVIWVAFEFLHSATQVSFPWLMLANTQTYDRYAIQFASITGSFGISFWILTVNVLVYTLSRRWAERAGWKISLLMGTILIGIYIFPRIYGARVLESLASQPSADSLRLAIVQPDIDPFEKWKGAADAQLQKISGLTTSLGPGRVDLIIWPETAVPFYLLHPQNATYLASIRRLIDSLEASLLTGIPDIVYYTAGQTLPRGSKLSSTGQYYNSYNSSILLQPGAERVQKYAKINLVPFAERVPYSEYLSVLNAAQWNFGLGGWAIGEDSTIFRMRHPDGTVTSFANLICYESIYPGFVAQFVRRGAEFLTVITNDSWWGNTSGIYQHKQFAVLRAVENRRWIIQCANGGISAVIDDAGRIVYETAFHTEGVSVVTIALRHGRTFYTEHGDWFAELCLVATLFFLAASMGNIVYHRMRSQQSGQSAGTPPLEPVRKP